MGELALDRAQVVGEDIKANIKRLPIDRVPKEFRSFHKDQKDTPTSELGAALNDGR